MPQLEIAAFNIDSALLAFKNGAKRVEFCAGQEMGGLSPNLQDFIYLKSLITIPIYVMIRPRAGNFYYSKAEFEVMKNEILAFKNAGADGFVFGILNIKNEVDLIKNQILVELAQPLACTFHKAFDITPNWRKALEQVIKCDFKTILTSGQEVNAKLGLPLIKQIIVEANNRIEIMPGGGIRANNINEIAQATKVSFYHSAAIIEENIACKNEIIEMVLQLNLNKKK